MIRIGTLDDCHAVYSLICEMENCELDYVSFREIYGKMLKCNAYAVLVAVEDNNVVGDPGSCS